MPRGAALLLLLILSAAPARAAEPPAHVPIRLEYTPDPRVQCPAEQVLRDEVTRHLGYDPFLPRAPARIAVSIRRDERTLVAQIEAPAIAGKRPWSREASYPADACLVLLSWVGNVIAFHLDRELSSTGGQEPQPPQAPPPAPMPPPSPVQPQVISAPPAPSQPPVSRFPELPGPPPSGQLSLGLGPQLTLGSSGPALGVLASVGYRGSFLSLGGELRYDAPSAAQAEGTSARARLHASAVGGALVPCAHLRGAFGCALLSGGVVFGSTSGVSFSHRVSYPFLGAGLRLGAEQALKPWLGIRLHLDGLVMVQTPASSVGGAPVHAPSPLLSRVNGAAGLDLVTYF